MTDTKILVGKKWRRTNVCEARIPEGKLRDMYVFCLKEGIDPTDMVKDGIQNRYYRLKRIAKGTDEAPEQESLAPDVDLKLTIGKKGVATA